MSVCDKCPWSDKTAKIVAVQIASSVSAAAMEYDCKNSVLKLGLVALR
jgi:hypothetical protein